MIQSNQKAIELEAQNKQFEKNQIEAESRIRREEEISRQAKGQNMYAVLDKIIQNDRSKNTQGLLKRLRKYYVGRTAETSKFTTKASIYNRLLELGDKESYDEMVLLLKEAIEEAKKDKNLKDFADIWKPDSMKKYEQLIPEQQKVVQEISEKPVERVEPPEEKQSVPPSSTSSTSAASSSSVSPAIQVFNIEPSPIPARQPLFTKEDIATGTAREGTPLLESFLGLDDESRMHSTTMRRPKTPLRSPLPSSTQLENTPENYQKVIDKAKQGGIYKGTGYGKGRGLYESEIKQTMNKYESFLGVYANDEIDKIADKVKPQSRGSAIINTANRKTGGQHWQAIYFDGRPNGSKTVEFYDSFGEEPTKHQLKAIKMIVDKLKADTYLKLKVNKMKKQSANSDNCGWFSMKFLIDRYRGKSFQEASGYNEQLKSAVGRGETEIRKFKSMYGGCNCEKFGYI